MCSTPAEDSIRRRWCATGDHRRWRTPRAPSIDRVGSDAPAAPAPGGDLHRVVDDDRDLDLTPSVRLANRRAPRTLRSASSASVLALHLGRRRSAWVTISEPWCSGLGFRRRIDHPPVQELPTQGSVPPLDLPGRGRRTKLGQDVIDTVLAPYLVNSTSPVPGPNRFVNTFPLSVRICSGTP